MDTPGFGDTDRFKRERNSQRVAQALTFGMNAFILVQKGELTRFSEQEQEILGYLHQWTNGAFWKRLIILDRASFGYDSLDERSRKDQSYWFESQSTGLDAFKRLVLEVGQTEKWRIRRNGRYYPLELTDLDGVRRLPFDAKQTIYCDKIRPGCTPVDSIKCRNRQFRRACHKMPIWEDEAPVEYREFDDEQNDDDFYHENEYENVLFWEDFDPKKQSKVFFYEQLKILAKYIKEANPKIHTNHDAFKQEVSEWNNLYDRQFISKRTDIPQCSRPRADQQKHLKQKAKCNYWGSWTLSRDCPVCGDGSKEYKRSCYNGANKKITDSLCRNGEEESTKEKSCWNKCSWTDYNRSNCYGRCHREYWRDCMHSVKGKVSTSHCRSALGGSDHYNKKWSGDCGGWGCKHKMSDSIWNWG